MPDSKDIHNVQSTHITSLPELVLVKIFRYLPCKQRVELEQVCQLWKVVSGRCWSDVKSLKSTKANATYAYNIIQRCGRYLRDLEICLNTEGSILTTITDECTNLNRLAVSYFCQSTINDYALTDDLDLDKLPNLTYLKIKNCIVTRELLMSIVNMPALTGLEILRCWNLHNESGDLLKNLTNIESLRLSATFSGDFLQPIVDNCRNIRELKLSSIKRITDLSPVLQLKKLETLELKALGGLVHDSFIEQLADNCKKIRKLSLSYNRGLTDDGIKHLRHFEELESLHLHTVEHITDNSLSTLKNLKDLQCHWCRSIGGPELLTLIQNSTKLENLYVLWCKLEIDVLLDIKHWMDTVANSNILTIGVDYDLYQQSSKLKLAKWSNLKIIRI